MDIIGNCSSVLVGTQLKDLRKHESVMTNFQRVVCSIIEAELSQARPLAYVHGCFVDLVEICAIIIVISIIQLTSLNKTIVLCLI